MLKSHKVLPRRRTLRDDTNGLSFTRRELRNLTEPNFESDGLSRRIQTWIPEPAPIKAGSQKGLPLTPPSQSEEPVNENGASGMVLKDSVIVGKNTSEGSGFSTPVNQRSPPTPDITPPREQVKAQMLPQSFISHDPSSRAESFKTARENQFSDDESHEPDSPVLVPSWQTWPDTTRHTRLRAIGLGLGLESDEEDKASTERTPRVSPRMHEFVTFDGAWGSDRNGVKDGSENAGDVRKHPDTSLRERTRKLPSISTRSPPRSFSYTEDAIPTITRGLSLRERVDRNRHSPASASTERFAEQIEWPLKEEHLDKDSNLREVDSRRVSQMSWASTVVEAMVVDTIPQRTRTLRHTGKNSSLRAVSSPIDRSNRSSLGSDDPSHRLVHRNTRIPDRGNRRSTESDTSASVNSSLARTRQESIPVVIIPERRSSLKSSATSSGRHSRVQSLTSARQQSSRPTTAPDEAVGYFDILRPARQTKPETISISTLSRPEITKVKDYTPVVPRRSASLSAPTSKNVSRTTSLTSANAHSPEKDRPQPALPVLEPVETRTTGFEETPASDWSALRARSSQVTPFSLRSVQSSTPGTLEVSEAQAINIYPHNNRSILVVQQAGRQDSEASPRSTIVAEQANVVLQHPITPPGAYIPRSMVDSPLRNPREPPRPPAFKVIPPTPANATPANDGENKLGRRTSSRSRSRPLSMVKRAFSTRRYSDTFVSPFTCSLTRRNTTNNARPNTGDDPNTKLSPFWRPRGFWDDISDSDSEFGNDGFLVSNSLGMPQKSVVPGPTFLGRRLGSLKLRRPSQRHEIRRKQSLESMHAYEFTREENRVHTMPRLGYQVQFVGFKDLQDRFERRKERKEEEKKEKERARLRKSIGPMIVQHHARVA